MDRLITWNPDDVLTAAFLNSLQDVAAHEDWVAGLLVGGTALWSLNGATVYVGPIASVVIGGRGYSAAASTPLTAATHLGSAFAPDTWYYVYAYVAAGALTFQISTDPPDAMRVWKAIGVGTHRYLGCFRTDAGATVIHFNAAGGTYLYRVGAYGGLLSVLAPGQATTLTTVALGAYVPPHACQSYLTGVVSCAAACAANVEVRAASDAGLSAPHYLDPPIATGACKLRREFWVAHNDPSTPLAAREVAYMWSAAPGAGNTFQLSVLGFRE